MARVPPNSSHRQPLALGAVLIAFLVGCGTNASELGICYSKFSPANKPEFRGAFTGEMTRLHEALVDAYNKEPSVVDIPIAIDGSLYLASTCEYVSSIRQSLDRSIVLMEISVEEYQYQADLAGESGGIIWMERN